MAFSPPPLPPLLVGKYNYELSENVDEYLKGLGVGLVLRKVQSVARPTVEISYIRDTDQWTIVSESVFKTKRTTFKPQVKFEDETFDARICQTSVKILDEGEKMVWEQVCEQGPNVETTIVGSETGYIMTMKSGEFTCTIRYRRNC